MGVAGYDLQSGFALRRRIVLGRVQTLNWEHQDRSERGDGCQQEVGTGEVVGLGIAEAEVELVASAPPRKACASSFDWTWMTERWG